MINEAVGILADGVAKAEDIDEAMKLGAEPTTLSRIERPVEESLCEKSSISLTIHSGMAS
ncbi:MAG TPA: 3-hydroxyacyl-CoA dehydrogenase family protein [Petrotogaceae bacterium]|nr:3-hydroxyacyl-CoA dehydrogenase family protein [Petrotogaceae bacterium]